MLKVKVFNVGIIGLENEINAWLSRTKFRKIDHIAFSTADEGGIKNRTIVLMFYEEAI